MASFDNSPGLDRPQFSAEPWFSADLPSSDDFLYNILTNSTNPGSYPNTPRVAVTGTASGSDPETASKRGGRGGAPGPVAGRVAKRKSRASKKNPTTFITADPANFRQMVQQVTGVKFAAGQASSMGTNVLKPEPQRLGGSAAALIGSRLLGCLPTLDTSAFLLDHHHHHQVASPPSILVGQSGQASAAPSVGEIGGDGGGFSVGGGAGGLDFGSFSCFPTLDSWKVM